MRGYHAVLFVSLLVACFSLAARGHSEPERTFQGDYNDAYSYCQAGKPDPASYPLPQSPSARLVALQLVTRHGDRSPCNVMPSDDAVYDFCNTTAVSGFAGSLASDYHADVEKLPTILASNPYHRALWKGNCLNGQLTSKGIQQLAGLGGTLRSIYVDKLGFLSGKFDPAAPEIYVRSTDVWRTQQSAESLLSGLFPDLSGQSSAIPIHTFPVETETMFANPGACPAYAYLQYFLSESADWQEHLLQNEDLLNRLTAAFDSSALNWNSSFGNYFDNLQVRTCHGLPLPCSRSSASPVCVSQTDAQQVFDLGDWEYAYTFLKFNQSATARLGIGAFMAVIRDVVDSFVSGSAKAPAAPKLFYYSGHDSTLGAVLGALNVTGWRWPPYASNILFELWRDDQQPVGAQYFVRAVYNGQLLQLPACSSVECSSTEWLAYMRTVIPTDFDTDCFRTSSAVDKNSPKVKRSHSPLIWE